MTFTTQYLFLHQNHPINLASGQASPYQSIVDAEKPLRPGYHSTMPSPALLSQESPNNFPLSDVEAVEPVDTCVDWATISVPDSQLYAPDDTGQLTIKAPLHVTCAVSEDYSFTIWLEAPDKPNCLRIANGTNTKVMVICCKPTN